MLLRALSAAPRGTLRALARASFGLAAALPLLAGLAVLAPAGAQAAAQDVAVGTRVRVTHPGGGRRVGTLVSLTADSLVARWAPGDTAAIPRAGMTHLEASRGMRSHRWLGAGLGLLAGTALGVVVGNLADRGGPDCAEYCFFLGGKTDAAGGAVVGGVVGAIIGGAVGATRRTEAWRRVAPGAGRIALAVPPRGRGAGAGVAISF